MQGHDRKVSKHKALWEMIVDGSERVSASYDWTLLDYLLASDEAGPQDFPVIRSERHAALVTPEAPSSEGGYLRNGQQPDLGSRLKTASVR